MNVQSSQSSLTGAKTHIGNDYFPEKPLIRAYPGIREPMEPLGLVGTTIGVHRNIIDTKV